MGRIIPVALDLRGAISLEQQRQRNLAARRGEAAPRVGGRPGARVGAFPAGQCDEAPLIYGGTTTAAIGAAATSATIEITPEVDFRSTELVIINGGLSLSNLRASFRHCARDVLDGCNTGAFDLQLTPDPMQRPVMCEDFEGKKVITLDFTFDAAAGGEFLGAEIRGYPAGCNKAFAGIPGCERKLYGVGGISSASAGGSTETTVVVTPEVDLRAQMFVVDVTDVTGALVSLRYCARDVLQSAVATAYSGHSDRAFCLDLTAEDDVEITFTHDADAAGDQISASFIGSAGSCR